MVRAVILRVLLVLFSGLSAENATEAPLQLRMRVIIPNPSVCLDEGSVTFEAELRNEGKRPIAIHPAAIHYGISFVKHLQITDTVKETSVSYSEVHDMGPMARDQKPVVLEPGSSYVEEFPFRFTEAFFEPNRTYVATLQYGYFASQRTLGSADVFRGSLQSNQVMFEVNDCGK